MFPILIGLIFGQTPQGFSLENQSDSSFDEKYYSKSDTATDHESSDDAKTPLSSDEDESSVNSQLDGLKPTVTHCLPPLHLHSKVLLVNSDSILSPLIKSVERPPKII